MKRSFIYLIILLFLPALLHAQSQPQYRVKTIKKDLMTDQGWRKAFDATFYYTGNRKGIMDAAYAKKLGTFFAEIYYNSNPLIQQDSLKIDSFLAGSSGNWVNYKKYNIYQLHNQQDILTERTRYDLQNSNFVLTNKRTYTYNNSLLIYDKDERLSNGSMDIVTHEYKYNNGQLDSMITNSTTYVSTDIYKYNNNGQLDSMIDINGSGNTMYVKAFTYNSNSLLHTENFYGKYNISAGMINKASSVYEYDANNKLTRHVRLQSIYPNTNFDTIRIEEYAYDNNGNLVEEYAEDRHGTTAIPDVRVKYFYDAAQKITEEIIWIKFYPNTWLDTATKLTYTYNSQSLVAKTELLHWYDGKWDYYPDTSMNSHSHIMTIDYEMYWPTSVAQTSVKEPAVKLYPSPSSDFIRVEAVWKEEKPFEAMICDMQGRVIRQWQEPANRFYTRTIPIPELPAGVYILKMQCGEESFSKQFVKQ